MSRQSSAAQRRSSRTACQRRLKGDARKTSHFARLSVAATASPWSSRTPAQSFQVAASCRFRAPVEIRLHDGFDIVFVDRVTDNAPQGAYNGDRPGSIHRGWRSAHGGGVSEPPFAVCRAAITSAAASARESSGPPVPPASLRFFLAGLEALREVNRLEPVVCNSRACEGTSRQRRAGADLGRLAAAHANGTPASCCGPRCRRG